MIKKVVVKFMTVLLLVLMIPINNLHADVTDFEAADVGTCLAAGSAALDIIKKLPEAKNAVRELFGDRDWDFSTTEKLLEMIDTRLTTFLNTGEKGYFVIYFHWSYTKSGGIFENTASTWFYIWTYNNPDGFEMKWKDLTSVKEHNQQLDAIHAYFNNLIEGGAAMKVLRSEDGITISSGWSGAVIEFLLHVK